MRILARSALGVVRGGAPPPESLGTAVRGLARTTEALAAYLEAPESPEETRRLALESVGVAAALLREREDLAKDRATNAFVDEVFSAAYDLLLSTGMKPAAASLTLEHATGAPTTEPGGATPDKDPPDTRYPAVSWGTARC